MSRMLSIQVYASNLHSGGGATASATAINAIVRTLVMEQSSLLAEMEFRISTTVSRELLDDVRRNARTVVRDDYPLKSLGRGLGYRLDRRLVLLGPDYRGTRADTQTWTVAMARSSACTGWRSPSPRPTNGNRGNLFSCHANRSPFRSPGPA